MHKGHNHDVTAGVWISIEDYVREDSTEGDQIPRTVRCGLCAAEYAAVFLGVFLNICHTPGGPDSLHNSKIVAEIEEKV